LGSEDKINAKGEDETKEEQKVPETKKEEKPHKPCS